MCGRRHVQLETTPADESYTGETVDLSRQARTTAGAHQAAMWRGGFPWWTLWLIWPLILLLKTTIPFIAGSLAALAQISVPLVPVLLIVIGILLLRRR